MSEPHIFKAYRVDYEMGNGYVPFSNKNNHYIVRADSASGAKSQTTWGCGYLGYEWTAIRTRREPALDGPERLIPRTLLYDTGAWTQFRCDGCQGTIEKDSPITPNPVVEAEHIYCCGLCKLHGYKLLWTPAKEHDWAHGADWCTAREPGTAGSCTQETGGTPGIYGYSEAFMPGVFKREIPLPYWSLLAGHPMFAHAFVLYRSLMLGEVPSSSIPWISAPYFEPGTGYILTMDTKLVIFDAFPMLGRAGFELRTGQWAHGFREPTVDENVWMR